MSRRFCLLIIFCSIGFVSHAQDIFDQLGKALVKSGGEKGAKQKQSLDSIDFQYTISINENAGFFDIEQKGEAGSKFLYALKDEKDKTQIEKIRDSLETGI